VALPARTSPTLPYWLAQPAHPGRYEVPDARLIGAPLGPPPLSAVVDVVIAGRAIRLARPVVYAWTDPVHGERVRPFVIVPPATVTPLRDAVLASRRPGFVDLRVRAGRDNVSGKVELALPAG